jgi:ADP-ribose pyrophosphatase
VLLRTKSWYPSINGSGGAADAADGGASSANLFAPPARPPGSARSWYPPHPSLKAAGLAVAATIRASSPRQHHHLPRNRLRRERARSVHSSRAAGWCASSEEMHRAARESYHRYRQRTPVPDERCSWLVPWPAYAPADYDDLADARNDGSRRRRLSTGVRLWADQSHETARGRKIGIDRSSGRPQNPFGRTGVKGRGSLPRWGPNFTADTIVTRERKGVEGGGWQVLLVRTGPERLWGLLSGQAEPPSGPMPSSPSIESLTKGGTCAVASEVARREFTFSVDGGGSRQEREQFNFAADAVWKQGRLLYAGYADDPRNTDNAWLETAVYHFHSDDLQTVPLSLGRSFDDQRPSSQAWHDVETLFNGDITLLPAHAGFLQRARSRLLTHPAHGA